MKRMLITTVALVCSFDAMASAQTLRDGQPPFFGPCGPPATLPNPNYSLVDPHDGEIGVEIDRNVLLLGLDGNSSASYLRSITLVPQRGFVVDVTVPKSPSIKALDGVEEQASHLGGIAYAESVPLPFLQIARERPSPYLEPNTTYILVLSIVDPNSPANCAPVIWTMSLGAFTTGPRKR